MFAPHYDVCLLTRSIALVLVVGSAGLRRMDIVVVVIVFGS